MLQKSVKIDVGVINGLLSTLGQHLHDPEGSNGSKAILERLKGSRLRQEHENAK